MQKTLIAAIAVVSLLASSLIVSAAPNENANGKSMNSNRESKGKSALISNFGKTVSSKANQKGKVVHEANSPQCLDVTRVVEDEITGEPILDANGNEVLETVCSRGAYMSNMRSMSKFVADNMPERPIKNDEE